MILVAFRNLPDDISASKCGDSTGFLYHVVLEVDFVQRHGLHNFRCLGFGQVSIVAVWAVFVVCYQDRHGPTQSDAQSSHASCPFGVSVISFLRKLLARGPEGLQALSLIEPEAWNHLDDKPFRSFEIRDVFRFWLLSLFFETLLLKKQDLQAALMHVSCAYPCTQNIPFQPRAHIEVVQACQGMWP